MLQENEVVEETKILSDEKVKELLLQYKELEQQKETEELTRKNAIASIETSTAKAINIANEGIAAIEKQLCEHLTETGKDKITHKGYGKISFKKVTDVVEIDLELDGKKVTEEDIAMMLEKKHKGVVKTKKSIDKSALKTLLEGLTPTKIKIFSEKFGIKLINGRKKFDVNLKA